MNKITENKYNELVAEYQKLAKALNKKQVRHTGHLIPSAYKMLRLRTAYVEAFQSFTTEQKRDLESLANATDNMLENTRTIVSLRMMADTFSLRLKRYKHGLPEDPE